MSGVYRKRRKKPELNLVPLIDVLVMLIFFAFVTAIWFTWGGIRDMRAFFSRLREERVDALDNGMVVNHHNLGEKP